MLHTLPESVIENEGLFHSYTLNSSLLEFVCSFTGDSCLKLFAITCMTCVVYLFLQFSVADYVVTDSSSSLLLAVYSIRLNCILGVRNGLIFFRFSALFCKMVYDSAIDTFFSFCMANLTVFVRPTLTTFCADAIELVFFDAFALRL